MEHGHKTAQHKHDHDQNETPQPVPPITGTAIAFWVLFFGAIALWAVIHHNIGDIAKSVEVWVASIFSLAVVIVVIIQTFIYLRQTEVSNAQLAAMEREAGAAEAALIISNRASVGIHSIEYDSATGFILIKIENIGIAPAERINLFLEVIVAAHLGYIDLDKTPTGARGFLRFRVVDKDYGSTKLLRGNLQIATIFDLRRSVREVEIDLIEHGHANLSVRGWIEYQDGFMQGRQRTEFFFWYEHRGNLWTVDDPVGWGAHFDMCGPADNEGGKDEDDQED